MIQMLTEQIKHFDHINKQWKVPIQHHNIGLVEQCCKIKIVAARAKCNKQIIHITSSSYLQWNHGQHRVQTSNAH